MTVDDSLARLRAGLDRDEAVALAAAERSAEWRSDGSGVDGGPFEPADPQWGIPESGKHTIVYDEGWPLAPEAVHIARQCPKATLDRVEAHRRVLDLYRRYTELDVDASSRDDRIRIITGRETLEGVLEFLADAYPDPTEES